MKFIQKTLIEIPFGQGEIDTMIHQAAEVLGWYDDMNKYTPNWYQNVQ